MEQLSKNQKVQEVMQKIITEAWQNETFKQDLVNSPKKTLEKFLGKTLKIDKSSRSNRF